MTQKKSDRGDRQFLKKEKDNFVAGKSDVFVVEACEYRRSFLNLSPKILVITNIDADHLDYYGNLAGVQKGFAEMVAKVPKNGFIVCDPGNTKVKPAIEKTKARIIDYTKEKLVVTLPVSGEHNRENARAALAVARLASVDTKKAGESLAHFHGTWRRMEYKGKTRRGVIVYDDYGHHPTEVRRTLQGFRERHKKTGSSSCSSRISIRVPNFCSKILRRVSAPWMRRSSPTYMPHARLMTARFTRGISRRRLGRTLAISAVPARFRHIWRNTSRKETY